MSRKKLILLSLAFSCLSACGNMAGKPSDKSLSSTVAANLSAGTPVAITGFYPAAGYVASSPTAITVNFSTANLAQAALEAITSYTLQCGTNNPVAAQAVAFVPGMSSLSVSFAAIPGLANGSVCAFQVSNNLKDGSGNFITGTHSAAYTINSSAAGGAGGWTAALTATPTGTVGIVAGTGFSGVGADGMILQGILVNGGNYVDGIMGVWAARFSATSLHYGQAHGMSAGGYSQISCPAGFRITGIHGKGGNYIDSIGIICKTEDYSQTYRSGTFGGAGGVSYELSCPAGRFATDLNGRASNYLHQLHLGCR
jgi:hypothetical protein